MSDPHEPGDQNPAPRPRKPVPPPPKGIKPGSIPPPPRPVPPTEPRPPVHDDANERDDGPAESIYPQLAPPSPTAAADEPAESIYPQLTPAATPASQQARQPDDADEPAESIYPQLAPSGGAGDDAGDDGQSVYDRLPPATQRPVGSQADPPLPPTLDRRKVPRSGRPGRDDVSHSPRPQAAPHRPPPTQPGTEPSVLLEVSASPPTPAARQRYDVREEIARGGMGAILHAVDKSLGRSVAMKVSRLTGGGGSADARGRFLREARITGQLEHPNIVPVHELATDDGRDFFTMKLVRGRSLGSALAELRDRMARGASDASFPLSQRLDVFRKVCDAIAYAHSRGVLHRDLKPDNIMVGEFGEVQVMDWGLARLMDEPEPDAAHARRSAPARRGQPATDQLHLPADADVRKTMDGEIMGTPQYMPPEQAEGRVSEMDERADVYSLGAILYELLALSPAFQPDNIYSTLAKVSDGQFPAPRDRVAADKQLRGKVNVPAELEAVVMKAMATNHRQRYRTATTLREDVDQFLDGRAVAAVHYNQWQLAWKWIRRNKALASTVATLVIAMMLVVFVVARAELQTLQAAEQARKDQLTENARRATEAYETASRQLEESAAKVPFNPSSPQQYFRARLPFALHIGRACQMHPDAPAEWRERLSRLTAELQENAQLVGDWAMAAHVVDAAIFTGAINEEEYKVRAAAVNAAQQAREQADIARLDNALQMIREAETKLPEEGGLAPGEFEEHARKIARLRSPAMTRELVRQHDLAVSSTAKAFLVDVIGRQGDVTTEMPDGRRVPQLALEGIRTPEDSFNGLYDWSRWVTVATRCEARSPGTYEAMGVNLQAETQKYAEQLANSKTAKTLNDLFSVAEIEGSAGMGGLASEALEAHNLIMNPSANPLPAPADVVAGESDPMRDRDAFTRLATYLADWVNQSATSGSAWTRHLLSLVENPRLSARQQTFVIELLGLHGDQLPPDPGNAVRSTPKVLWNLMTTASADELAASQAPAGMSDATFWRRRTTAIAAATALTRLEPQPAGLAEALYGIRTAGSDLIQRRTSIAFRMVEMDDWTEPTTADDFVRRGDAWLQKGDPERARKDARRAIELDDRNWRAEVLLGDAQFAELKYTKAENAYERAIRRIQGDDTWNAARIMVRFGRCREVAGAEDHALQLYNQATQLAPALVDAWLARAHLYAWQHKTVEARMQCDEAIRLNPDLAEAWLIRGLSWVDLDPDPGQMQTPESKARLDGLDRDFSRALRLDPGNTVAWFNRGIARITNGDSGGYADMLESMRLDTATVQSASYLFRLLVMLDSLPDTKGMSQMELMMVLGPKLPDIMEVMGEMRDRNSRGAAWLAPTLEAIALNAMNQDDQADKLMRDAMKVAPWRYRLTAEYIRLAMQ